MVMMGKKSSETSKNKKWKRYHESDFGWDEYGIQCPYCGTKYEDKDVENIPLHYCPNCGEKVI